MRKAVSALAALVIVLVVVIIVMALVRPSPPVQQWTQGYDVEYAQGEKRYMEPDHGAFYYWTMYHVFFRNPTPTYHVYVPPAGYRSDYRPWYRDSHPSSPRYTATPASAPQAPSTSPIPRPSRTSGGFSSSPAASAPSKPTRQSGGFSSPPSRPSSTPSRTSGGFSSKPSSSSSRTSGGFSKKK